MFYRLTEQLCDRLYTQARSSRILSALSLQERAMSQPAKASSTHPSLQHRMLRQQENSRILRLGRRFFLWVMGSSLSTLGFFLLVFGVAAIGGNWLVHQPQLFSYRLILPVCCLLSALPLLFGTSSLGSALKQGGCGWFLLDFCSFSQDDLGGDREGEPMPVLAFAAGLFLGTASVLLHPAWIGVLMLAIVLLLLFSARPELLLPLLGVILPFLELLPHTTVALLLFLLAAALLWSAKLLTGKRQTELLRSDPLILLFALLLAGGAIWSFGKPWDGPLRAVLLLLSLLLIRLQGESPVWQERFVRALLIGCTATAGYGIWQYLAGKAKLQWVDATRFYDIGGRVCSFFENPNILAVYLLLLLPLSLARMAETRGRDRILPICCFFSGSLCLLLTWSRGAWLGWLAETTLFLLLYSRKSLLLLLRILPFFLALLPFFPQNVKNRFLSIGSITESSIRYRMQTWVGVWRMLKAHPWGIGVGEAAFRAVYPDYALPGTDTVMHAHQLLLQITLEQGIPGLLLFLFALILCFAAVNAACRILPAGSTRRACIGGAAAIIGCLVMGLFDYIWYHNGLFFLFWTVFLSVTGYAGKGEV